MESPRWFYALSLWIGAVTPLYFACGAILYAAVVLYFSLFDAILVLVLLVLVYAALYILKVSVRMKRRKDKLVETNHEYRAFPSGHAGSSAYLIPTVTYTTPWGSPEITAIALALLALTVAYSRLALKVHRPFEVIAGLIVGGGLPLLILNALPYFGLG